MAETKAAKLWKAAIEPAGAVRLFSAWVRRAKGEDEVPRHWKKVYTYTPLSIRFSRSRYCRCTRSLFVVHYWPGQLSGFSSRDEIVLRGFYSVLSRHPHARQYIQIYWSVQRNFDKVKSGTLDFSDSLSPIGENRRSCPGVVKIVIRIFHDYTYFFGLSYTVRYF